MAAPTLAAQTAQGDWRTHLSGSEPFQISLPPTFVYTVESELGEGVQVHVFQEVGASNPRHVILTTYSELPPEARAAFTTKAALDRSVPFEFEEMDQVQSGRAAEANVRVFRGRSVAAGSVSAVVRGCDAVRCYSLSAEGSPDRTGTDWTSLADLLADFTFTD
ncbi:MAG: hypothetical protein AAF809_05920 [Bacteroidota bacterium]